MYDNNGKKLDVCKAAIDKYKVGQPTLQWRDMHYQPLPCMTLRQHRCTAAAASASSPVGGRLT